MLRIVLAVVLIIHGFVHARVWVPSYSASAPDAGPDPNHSWALGGIRQLTVVPALLAAAGFMAAGIAYWGDQTWWVPTTIASSALSLALIALVFNRWLLLGAAVSAAALTYAVIGAI